MHGNTAEPQVAPVKVAEESKPNYLIQDESVDTSMNETLLEDSNRQSLDDATPEQQA